jgi:hypothetical protein
MFSSNMAMYWTPLIVLLLALACSGEEIQEEREERETEGHNQEPDTLSFLKPESVAALGTLPFERLPKSVQRIVREVGDR